MAQQVILASASPRRRTLLGSLGVDFEVEAADVDETAQPGEAPQALVARLSRSKAQAVAAARREPLVPVLAADTVVALDGRILGKPVDPAEAVRMLRALRGRSHEVYTAVSVAFNGRIETQVARSVVWMRRYGDDEIAAYVATGDPLDKAGSYAIQHPLFSPVERWEGCYAGIMGLPLGVAADLLRSAGVEVSGDVSAVCERVSGQKCGAC